MKFLIFEFLGLKKEKQPNNSVIAYITSEKRRYTGQSVYATDFEQARRLAEEVCPQILPANLRCIIA